MDDRLAKLYEEHKPSEDESDIIVIQDLVETCPILHDFVRFTKFNGKPSDPPRLSYGVCEGRLYVSLTDAARFRSLRVESATFYDGCRTIENHINQGALDSLWYSWRSRTGKAAKKS